MDVEFLRHQFQDGYDGVITKNRFRIGVRHLQIIYMVASTVAMIAMRGSIGIAVLAINDVDRQNDTYIQVHNWDSRIQGTMLSSFFFGYALLLLPAELVLKNMGGKAVTTCILATSGMLCLSMPTIVNRGGWIATCNAFFMMGMTQACLNPANQNLLSKWVPPNEYYICSTLVYGGVPLGIILALPLAGIFAEARLGWELVFYSLAMLMLSMATICGILTASSPDLHQAVGDAEKEYVREALSFYKKKSVTPPWRSILKTQQFWALTSAHAACNAVFIFYLVEIPAYLKVLNVSMKDCGTYTLLAFVSMWFVYATTAPTFDWLSAYGPMVYIFKVSNFRKLVNAFGAFGVVLGLTVLSNLVPDWSNFAVVVLSATLGSVGFQFSGFLRSIHEMSENFSGTLLMMSSSIASVVGALTPLATGLIIGDDSNALQKWRIVFLLLASLCVVCNVAYTVLGSAERQRWDDTRIRHKFGYHNVSNQFEMDETRSPKTNPTK